MIIFGFVLFVLLFLFTIAVSVTHIIEGYKERDGWKIVIGILLAICGSIPSGSTVWILWPHV